MTVTPDYIYPRSATGALMAENFTRDITAHSGAIGFVPVATATDFSRLGTEFYGRSVTLRKVTIHGTATASTTVDILVQRSANGGGGTSAAIDRSISRASQEAAVSANPALTGRVYNYTVNRASGGNGISTARPVLASGKLHLAAVAGPSAPPLVFEFNGPDAPTIFDLNDWFVLNFNGQAVPAGTSLNFTWEWSERAGISVVMSGDSTTSNADKLHRTLGISGYLHNDTLYANRGSNGMRLQDVLLNTSSPTYPLGGSVGCIGQLRGGVGMPGVHVISYGINDLRQGAVTRNQLISMIDAAIYATLNNTTSAGTYTSTVGALTLFTWANTTTANPDARIILWGGNMITSDDPGATGYVTLTGRFAAMTLAQASQEITNDLWYASEFFRNDPRIFRVVQKQDIWGATASAPATVSTVALSGAAAYAAGQTRTNQVLMTDILHPNERGQILLARQIGPHIKAAVQDCQRDLY